MTLPKTTKSLLVSEVYSVDLDMAQLLLSYAVTPEPGKKGTNRAFSRTMVNEYARRMLAGQWRTTHQGIGFKGYFSDDTAELADGEQRLRAVIRAAEEQPDISIKMMVTQGLTEADMLTMDIGRRRTTGDFLVMHGEVDTLNLAAILRLCYLYEKPDVDLMVYYHWRRTPVTPEDQQAYLEANPDLRRAVREGRNLAEVMRSTAAGAGWFQAIKSGRDIFDVAEFVTRLKHGDSMSKGNPILTLRESLLRSEKTRRSLDTREQFGLFIKAYKKWERYKKTGRISEVMMLRGNEEFPRF